MIAATFWIIGCGRIYAPSPETLYNTAEQARRQGELPVALETTAQGMQLCARLHDEAWAPKLHLLRAEILLMQSRAGDARRLIENPPPGVAQSVEMTARLTMDRAELQRQDQKSDEARKLFAQARDLASRAGAQGLLARIELKCGELDTDFDEADAAFRRALDIATRRRDDYIAAAAQGNMGYIRLARSRYDDAIPWFEAADRAAQNIPSKFVHEKCLGNLGWCSFRLGQLDHAMDLYAQAERIAAATGLAGDRQRWLGNIGSIHLARKEFDQAVSYYRRAYDIAERSGDRVYVATWLNNIARVYIDQAHWDDAEQSGRRAMEVVESAPDAKWVEAYTWLNSGFIAAARARSPEAEADFGRAIRLAESEHQPNVAWQAHSGLAALYQSKRHLASAGREYAAAMNLLDQEWLALGRDASKITFRAFLASVYQDYVDFLSRQNQKEKALEVAEASRARLLAQKLEGSSDLPRFRAKEAVELARATNTLLLSYWLAPERSYLWAVTANGVSQLVLPAESRINALVEQHRNAIEGLQDPLSAGTTAACELYRTLIAPVEPLVHSAGQVIIVPDGSLHALNFETLVVDGATPHYWIEDVTVALVPSLAVLRAARPQPARPPRLLVVGDPLQADPAYPPLPHLKTEIQIIAADFPEPDRAVYTGAEAYAERFRAAGPAAFSAIHFAAHASANDESPLNSAIILSPHAGKYKLYVSDVAGMRIAPDVVTISACRSAGAKAYSGEGLIGFAWAFLEAGARNVVAGIWNVDDAAAPLLMREFYRDWRAHGNSAAALRDAKLKLMRSGGAFRKPYYWGSFEIFTRQATRSAMDLAWRNSSR